MLDAVDRILAPVTWLAAIVTVVLLLAGPAVVAEDEETSAAATGQAYDPAAQFRASCGGCHRLAAAGTQGGSGPALDGLRLDAATVAAVMRSGPGSMPSFDDLGDEEVDRIAAYVARASQR